MKLKITITDEVEIDDLRNYEATTLEEAAKNQQLWADSGEMDLTEMVNWDRAKITVEPVP
jgi:hypothetical protein